MHSAYGAKSRPAELVPIGADTARLLETPLRHLLFRAAVPLRNRLIESRSVHHLNPKFWNALGNARCWQPARIPQSARLQYHRIDQCPRFDRHCRRCTKSMGPVALTGQSAMRTSPPNAEALASRQLINSQFGVPLRSSNG